MGFALSDRAPPMLHASDVITLTSMTGYPLPTICLHLPCPPVPVGVEHHTAVLSVDGGVGQRALAVNVCARRGAHKHMARMTQLASCGRDIKARAGRYPARATGCCADGATWNQAWDRPGAKRRAPSDPTV